MCTGTIYIWSCSHSRLRFHAPCRAYGSPSSPPPASVPIWCPTPDRNHPDTEAVTFTTPCFRCAMYDALHELYEARRSAYADAELLAYAEGIEAQVQVCRDADEAVRVAFGEVVDQWIEEEREFYGGFDEEETGEGIQWLVEDCGRWFFWWLGVGGDIYADVPIL